MKQPRGFKRAFKNAEKIVNDKSKILDIISKGIDKAKINKKAIQSVWDDLHLLIELVRAWVKGEYKHPSWTFIVSVVAAIIYFLNPFDIIPDVIFGIGYMDDIAVIRFVINAFAKEINKFREWKNVAREKLTNYGSD